MEKNNRQNAAKTISQCLPRMRIQAFDCMAESCGGDSGEGPLTSEEEPSTSTSSVNEGLSSSLRSVFDALRAPTLSELTRKRSIHCNPPPKGKRRARGEGSSEPKRITPSQRLKEFPEECLEVTGAGKKLFCRACREELSLKKNIIVSHVSSAKHRTGKDKLASKEASERDIAKLLKEGDINHPVGETLPMDQRVYRVKVLKSFLRAVVPLAKVEHFRELLEENSFRLTDRRHMSDLIPLLLSQLQADIKKELSGRPISVVFDGTTRLGEAMAVVIRYIDSSFTIKQRLIRLQLLAKSMSGEEIAREIIASISTQFGIASNQVVAMMHDRAACNGVALRTLKVIYPQLVDVGCFSHTLDLVGEKFSVPHLSAFTIWWISLFSHSPRSKLLWKERTGRAFEGYSATRWWSKYEVMRQLVELFADVEPFLEMHTDISPATRGKLLSMLRDDDEKKYLMVELAATIDAATPFVKATYNLEGDGPLALTCYEAISALNVDARQAQYPNLEAVAHNVASDHDNEDELIQYAKSCVQPGLTYYFNQLATSMKGPLEAFKAARLFSPAKLQQMKPAISYLDNLSIFPFLSPQIPTLKEEFPLYVAASEDIDPSYDPMHFWRQHEQSLPAWSQAARQVILIQPSSAASERVFSLLRNPFGERQNSALQDYIEASLMMQYNDC